MAGKPAIAKEDERDQSNRQNKREITYYIRERNISDYQPCQTKHRSYAAHGIDELDFLLPF
ncbi:MAG: hypothetical protein ACI90V_010919 [Bacillariaceae sp.]|jgi:hypothetical protein